MSTPIFGQYSAIFGILEKSLSGLPAEPVVLWGRLQRSIDIDIQRGPEQRAFARVCAEPPQKMIAPNEIKEEAGLSTRPLVLLEEDGPDDECWPHQDEP